MSRSEQLALLLAAAAVSFQIFVPPVVGIADNADFGRIIGSFDLGSPFGPQHMARFIDLCGGSGSEGEPFRRQRTQMKANVLVAFLRVG